MHSRHFLYARLDAIDCLDWIRLSADAMTSINVHTDDLRCDDWTNQREYFAIVSVHTITI
ncbi:hypothetical protein [uncultured Nostoc sp.]|uniref:hypothetical protein n=1 Tax=uncultured Nostoc sp. TaxID=340711 RepID=UPI0035CB2F99